MVSIAWSVVRAFGQVTIGVSPTHK